MCAGLAAQQLYYQADGERRLDYALELLAHRGHDVNDNTVLDAVEAAEKTYPVELPLLQNGSEGESVKALQILLTGLGYDAGGADGQFGANTETALKGFQSANGLKRDGKCGPETWAALLGSRER